MGLARGIWLQSGVSGFRARTMPGVWLLPAGRVFPAHPVVRAALRLLALLCGNFLLQQFFLLVPVSLSLPAFLVFKSQWL